MTEIRLFCTDLDGTLIGNPATTHLFTSVWNGMDQSKRPLLVYNSGRLVEDISAIIGSGDIPEPDFVIGGVGTEVVDYRARKVLDDYQTHIAKGWNREQVDELIAATPGIERQPDQYQNSYKSSWYIYDADDDTIETLHARLADSGINAAVIYSSNRDLDIVPAAADKGKALAWLLDHLAIDSSAVVVAGDRGNDRGMFEIPEVRGILVENAQPELFEIACSACGEVYQSEHVMAEGLLDGLAHFGVATDLPDSTPPTIVAQDEEMTLLFAQQYQQHLTPAQIELIRDGYVHAIDAIRRNITPIGFSACSLDDNEVTGTDVNYRSVWGRDGAITLINTLCVNDPAITACAKRTLQTLLGAVTDAGLVPANVRIDDGSPDYSGVGGICAVDSALWVVIALYNFVRHTGDEEFLSQHQGELRRIMRWLEALDANRDGLLEVPEASDWTDLFGRSYNVLYDEILWYRAKVCFGRMLEMLGHHEEAADAAHQSQHIRGKILRTFWPTTHRQDETIEATFADMQYSLGDARYLLAEVSPFNFNWRCDVLGNILGFLTNVLDVPKARTALSFMWGVGVNDPWPVSNLYPVVQAGDPDWKPYYTVNLLNLPHHYHNGGIWPFVGGLWVRFIHRLGQHQAACQELVRLAECNRQGRAHEWEFNEWCHGTTGRPMGKAYQAWSAATFIHACHELGLSAKELPDD
ncbi:MAG: HAD-IIB family hydrolase [Planctomycetota bacterium]|jgi:sucrose-6F-phosphate phosphohydrolase|nr:HAD-IIB family hydrolase [Planctomycetota bacterium]